MGNSGNSGTSGSPVTQIPPPVAIAGPNSYTNEDLPTGVETRPVIGRAVRPDDHGNGIIPPHTNLIGPPSSFQDDITATGGGIVVQTKDSEKAERPVTWAMTANQWMYDNRSTLLVGGIAIFMVVSVM